MDTLKIMIARRGIKQRFIAMELLVSDQAVSMWASRQRDIPTGCIRPLARLLGVPISAVLAVATRDAPK